MHARIQSPRVWNLFESMNLFESAVEATCCISGVHDCCLVGYASRTHQSALMGFTGEHNLDISKFEETISKPKLEADDENHSIS